MIKSFIVTNHLGESLELILADPDSSGLAVLSVTGLGQVQADVNLTDLAGSDFHTVNSAKLTKRNIVFKVKYWGNDIEESRHLADKFFPVKKVIKLQVNTTHRNLITTGIVEKNEPDIFSNKTTGQISILCPDPFLYSLTSETVPFGGIEPKFEFPFPTDETPTDDDGWDTIEFGNIRITNDKSIYYTGEAETGITIQVDAIGPVRKLAFYDINNNQKIKINDDIIASITGGQSIMAGDRIIISTSKTEKYATLIRGGEVHNIINALGMPVQWFELDRGDNIFSYSASEGAYDMIINIKHRVAYKGI
jgi:hypothetical protein